MLSKNNKILIGCLALLLVMSVGYALFSDTITINGTAIAKGDFKLTVSCDMDEDALYEVGAANIGSVTDAKINCEGNVVNASATLDYPGTEKWFRVMVGNTGTIPAKLKRVVELNNPEDFIVSKENNTYMIENKNGSKENRVYAIFYHDSRWVDDYESPYDASLPDSSWHDEMLDVVLDPGETIYFFIQMLWER